MDYPAYPVYRESGIEWLGKIPDHWEVKRLKYAFQLLTEKTERKDNPVGLENIEGWSGRFIETDSEFQGDGVAFEQGDILFGKLRPYLAKVHLAQFAGEAVGDFHVLRPIGEIIGVFGLYQCLNKDFITNVDSSTYGAKMPRVSWEYMANMLLVFPSLTEQRKISAFLDHKTQQIDQLISKKQTLIDKLNEQRIALITHAVTKGLNPAVTLEDSGVEWLGEVPEHWEVVKLSYRYEVLLGKMLDDKRITGDFLGEYLRNTDVQWGRINYESLPQMDFRPDEYERYSIKKGDLVVCEGGEIGRCAIWERETPCFYQKALHRLRPIDPKNDNVRFMFYVLFDAVHQERFINGASKATIAHLPAETFRQYRFAYPPMIEQREIVEYLDKETARIDRMVGINQQTIDKLKEYRTALITAAVTGKIDLRTWQKMETKGA